MDDEISRIVGMLVDKDLAATIFVTAAKASSRESSTFCGLRLIVNPLMPPDQIAMVDDAGTVLNVIRLNR